MTPRAGVKAMPKSTQNTFHDGRGAHPDVDEHRQPVTRHGLGAGHARRVDDGAEHQPDPAVRERGVDRPEIGPPVGHGD